MIAEIITVGTELLMGQTINTNLADISKALQNIGIGTYYQSVVGDNIGRIVEVLDVAIKRSELIIISGGIGPTEDDITKEALANYTGYKLVIDDQQQNRLIDFFKKSNRSMTENNLKQALTFKEAFTFNNLIGLACGMSIDIKNRKVIVLPGPPIEMKAMLHNQVIPYLIKLNGNNEVIKSEFINLYGIGESVVANKLKDIINQQSNPTIAVYAKPRKVSVRVTVKGEVSEMITGLLNQTVNQVISIFPKEFIGLGENYTLEEYIIENLLKKGKKVAFSESLTGGLVMSSLISKPSASKVIVGGFVTYQTEMKTKILGVSQNLIKTHSVVSEEVAKEMAEKTLKLTGANYAVSLTGVAGPNSLDGVKPGHVYIGLADENQETKVKHLSIQYPSRDMIQNIAKDEALIMLKEAINK